MEKQLYFKDSEIVKTTFLLRVNQEQQQMIIDKTNKHSTKFDRVQNVSELISKEGIKRLAKRNLKNEIKLN